MKLLFGLAVILVSNLAHAQTVCHYYYDNHTLIGVIFLSPTGELRVEYAYPKSDLAIVKDDFIANQYLNPIETMDGWDIKGSGDFCETLNRINNGKYTSAHTRRELLAVRTMLSRFLHFNPDSPYERGPDMLGTNGVPLMPESSSGNPPPAPTGLFVISKPKGGN